MKTQNAVMLAALKKRKINKRDIADVLAYEPESEELIYSGELFDTQPVRAMLK